MLKPEQILTDYDRIKECVSKGLERSFGEDVMEVILYQFKLATNSNTNESILDYQALKSFLERFFGVRGSKVVEGKVVEEIKREFDLAGDRSISLESAVLAARLIIERQHRGSLYSQEDTRTQRGTQKSD